MYVCLGLLTQNTRKSGFGASDELSSEEEEEEEEEEGEELPAEETIPPISHQEANAPTNWPISATACTVRKRVLKSNPKPTFRPQVIVRL